MSAELFSALASYQRRTVRNIAEHELRGVCAINTHLVHLIYDLMPRNLAHLMLRHVD